MNTRISRVAVVALATTAAVLAFAGTAGAVTGGAQVDQSSSDTSNQFDGFISGAHGAWGSQTFTPGVSGQLTDVTATLESEFNSGIGVIRAAINPTDLSGNPSTGVELAVATIPTSSLPDFTPTDVDFTFSTPAVLVAGTTYAITLTEVSGTHQHFYWSGGSTDTYAGGVASDTWGASGDFAFATYMVPAQSAGGANRAGYCLNGAFENLAYGQPSSDPRWANAVPAIFVQGLGLTCNPPPAGWTQHGFAGVDLDLPANMYALYAPAG